MPTDANAPAATLTLGALNRLAYGPDVTGERRAEARREMNYRKGLAADKRRAARDADKRPGR